MRGGMLVCGTSSDAGKSFVVAGLCRLLARQRVKVAPFKAQNMALNSFVTPSGHEIGRAQAAQAMAAGIDPEPVMNPVLLKPTGDRSAQVVLLGAPVDERDAVAYESMKPQLFATVLGCLQELRSRFDVVIAEGAGSPAEINLLAGDIVNLPLAAAAGLPALVVGDIDRGGVFASLFGTVGMLPPELRSVVRAFVLNKFRGDPALLGDGPADLERRTGVPTIGVLPMLPGAAIDGEDSLVLERRHDVTPPAATGDMLDVAVVRLPRLSNFTDVDPLLLEPQVGVR
ncbi:MAG TPA: cobyric acid synthase, partial [Acidimicrobiales bacterium]|nr:cobyric acid synthase [Acidimicrobiales bacterium]